MYTAQGTMLGGCATICGHAIQLVTLNCTTQSFNVDEMLIVKSELSWNESSGHERKRWDIEYCPSNTVLGAIRPSKGSVWF